MSYPHDMPPASPSLRLGIDEAGRGCVLGPLVVGIVAATEKDRRWFASLNVRDSKLVPPKQREELAEKIRARCWFQLKIATAIDVDIAVRDRSRTLNGLELEMMATCVRDVIRDFAGRDSRILVDAPSINAEGFRKKLHEASGWDDIERLHAKHHADELDRTVGAASIVAKSERERLIALIKQELGCDFGSGYSHDERTITHIKSVARGATHVRWSWATAQRLVE
ncbi:MAG: ribonuclease HII [Patescibacteria group bacterium]